MMDHVPHTAYTTAGKVADAAAAATVGAASMSWVSEANDIMTLIATTVAVLVGMATLAYHFERWKALRKRNKEESK